MKCLKIGCEKEVPPDAEAIGYEACSSLHGADIRLSRAVIKDNFNAYNARQIWGSRENYTIQECETYLT
jgi:hypothetical protein